nr:reverse transcriptase domain-containing protein [Tanacetum cinerariifolium]
LKTSRALIDVHKGELTLRIENEAITYNLDQTVLGFSDTTVSGNPTPIDDPIVLTTSPALTLFRDSDFLLFEEADAFLGLEDDPDSPKINPFYYDPEGDILLLEAILNSEPLPPLPNHKQYLPSYKKELKVCEAKTVKSSVDEPLEVELKDLPHHLEYAFLEGDDKLPAFSTLKDKLTEAPILIAPNWDQPFELTCDASDYAVGAEFDFKVIDTRGAENYAADHLSRLENPYENIFDPKEINEAFPFETLNKIAHNDPSTTWYADLANYHAGNFIIK